MRGRYRNAAARVKEPQQAPMIEAGHGQVSLEDSPWGARIRAAREAYEPETPAPPK